MRSQFGNSSHIRPSLHKRDQRSNPSAKIDQKLAEQERKIHRAGINVPTGPTTNLGQVVLALACLAPGPALALAAASLITETNSAAPNHSLALQNESMARVNASANGMAAAALHHAANVETGAPTVLDAGNYGTKKSNPRYQTGSQKRAAKRNERATKSKLESEVIDLKEIPVPPLPEEYAALDVELTVTLARQAADAYLEDGIADPHREEHAVELIKNIVEDMGLNDLDMAVMVAELLAEKLPPHLSQMLASALMFSAVSNLSIVNQVANSKDVSKLLALGADHKLRRSNGFTALSEAVRKDCSVMVKTLRQAYADPYALNADGSTPMSIASKAHAHHIIPLLKIDNYPTVKNLRGSEPRNADEDIALLKMLRRYAAKKTNFEQFAEFKPEETAALTAKGLQYYALQVAVAANSLELAGFYIQKGYLINLQRDNFESELVIACTNGDPFMVRLLLENGAKANARYTFKKPGIPDAKDKTRLTYPPSFIIDLESMPKVFDPTNQFRIGFTNTLFQAIASGSKQTMVWLLKTDTALLSARSMDRLTPLQYARKLGDPTVVALLTEAEQRYFELPLTEASLLADLQSDNFPAAKEYFFNEPHLNSESFLRPIMEMQDTDLVCKIIDFLAARELNVDFALRQAVYASNHAAMKLLLQYNGDLLWKDNYGDTTQDVIQYANDQAAKDLIAAHQKKPRLKLKETLYVRTVQDHLQAQQLSPKAIRLLEGVWARSQYFKHDLIDGQFLPLEAVDKLNPNAEEKAALGQSNLDTAEDEIAETVAGFGNVIRWRSFVAMIKHYRRDFDLQHALNRGFRLACLSGFVDIAKETLRTGADPDFNGPRSLLSGARGRTPLTAVLANYQENHNLKKILKLLLQTADPSKVDELGDSPLALAKTIPIPEIQVMVEEALVRYAARPNYLARGLVAVAAVGAVGLAGYQAWQCLHPQPSQAAAGHIVLKRVRGPGEAKLEEKPCSLASVQDEFQKLFAALNINKEQKEQQEEEGQEKQKKPKQANLDLSADQLCLKVQLDETISQADTQLFPDKEIVTFTADFFFQRLKDQFEKLNTPADQISFKPRTNTITLQNFRESQVAILRDKIANMPTALKEHYQNEQVRLENARRETIKAASAIIVSEFGKIIVSLQSDAVTDNSFKLVAPIHAEQLQVLSESLRKALPKKYVVLHVPGEQPSITITINSLRAETAARKPIVTARDNFPAALAAQAQKDQAALEAKAAAPQRVVANEHSHPVVISASVATGATAAAAVVSPAAASSAPEADRAAMPLEVSQPWQRIKAYVESYDDAPEYKSVGDQLVPDTELLDHALLYQMGLLAQAVNSQQLLPAAQELVQQIFLGGFPYIIEQNERAVRFARDSIDDEEGLIIAVAKSLARVSPLSYFANSDPLTRLWESCKAVPNQEAPLRKDEEDINWDARNYLQLFTKLMGRIVAIGRNFKAKAAALQTNERANDTLKLYFRIMVQNWNPVYQGCLVKFAQSPAISSAVLELLRELSSGEKIETDFSNGRAMGKAIVLAEGILQGGNLFQEITKEVMPVIAEASGAASASSSVAASSVARRTPPLRAAVAVEGRLEPLTLQLDLAIEQAQLDEAMNESKTLAAAQAVAITTLSSCAVISASLASSSNGAVSFSNASVATSSAASASSNSSKRLNPHATTFIPLTLVQSFSPASSGAASSSSSNGALSLFPGTSVWSNNPASTSAASDSASAPASSPTW